MDQPTNSLWEKVTADAQLLTLPAVYLRLRAVLDDPDYAITDIEDVISMDPAVSTRLLRQVNSPYFGFASRIETIPRAVGLLGSQQVHDLVLATSVAQTFSGIPIEVMDMHAFWSRSVYCAAAARLLAANCNMLESERLFVAGLLRDIGHLVMYQSIPDESKEALLRARSDGRALYLVEREVVGFDYAQLGGALLYQWGLPEGLWEPVQLHITPEQSADYSLETSIVHLAGVLSDVGQTDDDECESLVSLVHPSVWQATGVTPEQCVAIQEEVERQIDDVMFLIFPGSKTVHPGSTAMGGRTSSLN
ncbi:MAG: HDOD domain-containing protein [Gammaproteobacteria bacterium]